MPETRSGANGWGASLPGAVAGLAALAGLYALSRHDFLLFHTLVELSSVAVAVGIFMVFWNSRQFLEHGFFLFLGVSLVCAGALDLAHSLTYKGMPFGDQHADVPTQLWIAARGFEASSFVLAFLFVRRRLPAMAALGGGALAVAALLASILWWPVFPRCFMEGVGLTPFKVVSEYVICLMLLGALGLLFRHRGEFDRHVFRLLAAAIGATIVSELAFTFYVSAYGLANFAGHVLKVLAFYLLYRAMVEISLRKPYQLLFRELKQTVERLGLLSRVSEQLLARGEPGEVIQGLCGEVMRHLDCQVFFNYLIDEQGHRLTLNACGGELAAGSAAPGWIDCRGAACGGASRQDCRIASNGLAHSAGPILDPRRDLGLAAHACHPLLNDGRMIGVLGFASRTKPRFEEGEMALVKAVADQVAMALERVRLFEALRRRAAEAQAANEAKSQFLANISHELRTPLGAILGMTELALGETNDAALRDYLSTTKESADGLLELLNELLDFSRMEAGKLELEPVPFSLRRVLEKTLKALGVRAYEKGLELVCDVAPDVPDRLVGDAKRLRQIVWNLVGNAVKFTAKGEVVVRAALESLAGDGAVLRLEVEDTGIGIKPDDCRRIFAPFTQADASTSRQFGGAGLGLAIVSKLVGVMGGQVGVQSEPGRGSCFHFTVRMGLQPAWAESPDTSLDGLAQLSDLRVLIVDDNPASRRLLEQVLARWSMQPALAADAPAALAMIHEAAAAGQPYAVAIVDATIPGTDGCTLVRWLNGNPGLVGATVLMVSAADRHALAPRSPQAGAVLLDKPISQSALFDALMGALGKAPARAAPAAGAPAPPPARTLRVLLAEDTAANQKLVLRVLGKRGHDVVAVGNGREAVARIESEEFDLVLMDVQMPTMDGFQATAAVRALADPRKAGLKIVAMTAHAMKGDQQRCLAAGMDCYLAKPIDIGELVELVERVGGAQQARGTRPVDADY